MKTCIFRRLVLGLCLFVTGVTWADNDTANSLPSIHQAPLAGVLATPIAIQSDVGKEQLGAEIHAMIEQPFADLARSLTTPENWCEFVPLNYNVKACTHQQMDGDTWLTFYAGSKEYGTPDDAHPLRYRVQVLKAGKEHFHVQLNAEEGPFGTRDYRIELEAIPSKSNTSIRLRSSYKQSLRSRLATSGYLKTAGRNKIGFSVVGQTSAGLPIYVGGVKGIIERNAMRYYLALKAFLATWQLPTGQRFEALSSTWFKLNEAHRKQLHEMNWNDYIQAKRRERQNQLQLQQQLTGKQIL